MIIICSCKHIKDFPITYKKCFGALAICMGMSTPNSKHGYFPFNNNKNTYPKGKALMQMYRVVPQMKRENNENASL